MTAEAREDMATPDQLQLFAVQAELALEDYASPEAFNRRQRARAERIAALRPRDASGAPRFPALAVWPEMLGSALGLMGHLDAVRGCTTTHQAMTRVALRMLSKLALALRHRPRALEEALYLAVAPAVHRTIWTTFSELAREFDLWIVAGSALLPMNRLGPDTPEFVPVSARTFNTSYTFAPSGQCVAVTRKVNLVPTQEDVIRLSPGRPEDLGVVDAPFGKLGTLICYDAFCEPHTEREPGFKPGGPLLDALGAEIIAQPSANAWPWDAPWAFNAPGENQLRREQWFNEGLFTQLRSLQHVRYVVNPQLVGRLFENTFEAPSLILERLASGEVKILAQAEEARSEALLQVMVPLDRK